jgi:hypothetical protein
LGRDRQGASGWNRASEWDQDPGQDRESALGWAQDQEWVSEWVPGQDLESA